MSKDYTLSLSRWHKVAERLSRIYTELTQSARNTFNNTQVGGYLGVAQVDRLKMLAAASLVDMHRAFEVQDAIASIRQAIGDANARTGVARELAAHDALSRRHKFLDSILVAQGSEMIGLDELPALPSHVVSEDRYDRSRGQIRVRILSTEDRAEIKREAEALLSRVYSLADRISDLNRERISLALADEIAAQAGL
ncbi:MAG: hypothetical protein JNK92_11850 [Dechloromonas sp.]|nr:hypothetical protein [Dechloromonas sp.]